MANARINKQLIRNAENDLPSLSPEEELLAQEVGSSSFPSLLPPLSFCPESTARIVMIEQKSLAQEMYSKDGEKVKCHLVVKNLPFLVSIGLQENPLLERKLDFNSITVEVALLFDGPDQREVPYVKQKPVEYRGVVSEDGQSMKMEVKIKVLTSHYENMLFRLRITCADMHTNDLLPGLELVSDAIKVLSKPTQIRKRKAVDAREPAKPAPSSKPRPKSSSRKHRPSKRARTTTTTPKEEQHSEKASPSCQTHACEYIFATLQRLEQEQKVARQLLENIQLSKPLERCPMVKDEEPDLDKALNGLIDTFLALPVDQRAERIRKVLRNSSTRKIEIFAEMIALFNAEGLQGTRDCFLELGPPSSSTASPSSSPQSMFEVENGCCASGDCPHQKELQRLEEFYTSFMN